MNKMFPKRICPTAAVLLAALLALGGCMKRQGVERVEWTVMGTVAAVQAKGSRALTGRSAMSMEDVACNASADVRSVFTEVETLLNAHNATSEISTLAGLSDEQVLEQCTRKIRPCYEAAFALRKTTGGVFNPRWRGERTLDLGGIAKGFAVDSAAERLRVPPGAALLIDLGGNLKAVKGTWRTGVKNPGGSGFAATVELKAGEALATSAKYFRGDHISDGRTGTAVANGVASVTVLCGSATMADGLSTALFVLGPEAGRAFLERFAADDPKSRPTAVLWLMSDGSRVALDPGSRFN